MARHRHFGWSSLECQICRHVETLAPEPKKGSFRPPHQMDNLQAIMIKKGIGALGAQFPGSIPSSPPRHSGDRSQLRKKNPEILAAWTPDLLSLRCATRSRVDCDAFQRQLIGIPIPASQILPRTCESRPACYWGEIGTSRPPFVAIFYPTDFAKEALEWKAKVSASQGVTNASLVSCSLPRSLGYELAEFGGKPVEVMISPMLAIEDLGLSRPLNNIGPRSRP